MLVVGKGGDVNGLFETALFVRDLSRAADFYQHVLGLGVQLFALLDSKRHVFTHGRYTGLDQQRSSLNHVAFEIDSGEFMPAKKRLENLGLTVQVRDFPHLQASGLFFADPEGNQIELICHRSPAT